MSSFSIYCTTCKSRLKVRDESAIGQIVGCPKCGSMVLIEAPTDTATAELPTQSSSHAASMPDTVADSKFGESFEEAASWFDDPADEDFDVEDVTIAEQPPPPLPESAAVAATPPPLKTQPSYVTPPSAPPPPGEQNSTPVAADAPLAAESWTSPAAHQTRRIALVAGAVFLGIAGVVALALFATTGGDGQASPSPLAPTGPDVAQNQPDLEHVPPADPPEAEVPQQPIENTPTEETPAENPTVQPHAEVIVSEPPIESETPTPSEIEKPTESLPPKEPIVSPEPAPAESNEPPPLFADDPPANPPANTNSGLAALDALLPFLDGAPEQEPPAETPPVEVAPAETETLPPNENEVASLPQTTADLSPVKPEPRKIDLAARLNDPIEAIEIPNTSLIDFLRMMSDFSTIPISLDPLALSQLKLTPDQELSVVMGQTTVGEVLERAASRVNLVVEPGPGQLTITHNRNLNGPLRQAKYTVSDLVGTNSQELAQLKELILAQIAPGTWQETGGKGTIEAVPGALLVRHIEPVHHRLVLFVEKLRLARGLPLRSSYDRLLFDSQERNAVFDATLAKNVSLNYFEPTRLMYIVARLEKVADIRILIDWEALLSEGWTPDTEATLSVADATLAETFDQLLGPRGMTLRVIDRQTVQITTPAALSKTREVEFYPVADTLAKKNWKIADLQSALLPKLTVADEVARPILGYDEPSGNLVVSASVASHARIDQLLGEL